MADATLADKLQQTFSQQEAPAPLQEVTTASGLDPFAALQQHLESCHATLNIALRQNMEEAQKQMQHAVQQALLSAL
eukprot:1320867-Prorocentrum_lima.AAC.1